MLDGHLSSPANDAVHTDARLAPAEHKKFVEAEINKWGPAIKAAGQYAD